VAGRIRSIEKFSDLIRNRTLNLPAWSIVPQPTTLPRAPEMLGNEQETNLKHTRIPSGLRDVGRRMRI
jgi:hypothetical protein